MTEKKIEIAGRKITISHPDKLLFSSDGLTKANIAEYYARIGEIALPHYRDRPLSMQRFPDGIDRDGFFQKNASDYFPDWIKRARMKKENGTVDHVVVDTSATLVYLANQGMISPHLALSRADKPDYPDRMVFDLDPPGDDFTVVQRAARWLREMFDGAGIPTFVQTTGSRGMHVVVPLDRSARFDRCREVARSIAESLAQRHPRELTVEQRKEKRGDRLFLDTGRNAYGQTAIAPYGLRALPHAPVATPLDWQEALANDMRSGKYRVSNIFRRLARKPDPWTHIDERAIPLGQIEQGLKE